MHFVINRSVLQFDRDTAMKIGINEAMLLQQIHELSLGSEAKEKGTQWVSMSYNEWQGIFSFWSTATIIRAIRKLENAGYIHFRRHKHNEKNYMVNYEECELESIRLLQPASTNGN